jgi:hypothetical protein
VDFNEGNNIGIFGGNLVRGGLAIEHNDVMPPERSHSGVRERLEATHKPNGVEVCTFRKPKKL